MSSPAQSGRVYRFGVFEVDRVTRELLRHGTPVRLQDQPFRVLCMLLEKAGQVVTRDELRQALWPSDTYVEFDGSLNAALKKLRFALGDSARNPAFIVTVTKYGYRFVAPVAVEAAVAEPVNGQIVGRGSSAGSRKRWIYSALLCAAVILVQQIVYWLFPLPPPRVINRTRLTNIGNVEPGPIVSDGTRIFFCARHGARRFPMQTSINGGDAVEIKTPFENSTILDISPDRTNFLLGSSDRMGDAYKLWVWPVQRGAPHRFGEAVCNDAVWSPDGRRVAWAEHGSLYSANTDASSPHLLARTSANPAYRLVWSPDASKLEFSTFDPVLGMHGLWEVGADGTHLHKVFPGNKRIADISTGFRLGGGRYFGFLEGAFPHHKLWMTREARSLWRRSRPGPFPVATGAEDTEIIFDLGQNSSRLISIGYWPNNKLCRLSADSHSLVTESLVPSASSLHFSRDGKWVAYTSIDGSLWRCRASGSDCLQLTSAPTVALEPRWSPDGAQILFMGARPNEIRHLYVMAAQIPGPPKALGPQDLVAGLADWSPDGTEIALDMSAPPPDAPNQLYLIDVATGKTNLLPGSEGFHSPAWSRDGSRIAAVADSQSDIYFYVPESKSWLPGPKGTRITYVYWSYRSDDLFYQDSGEPGQPIYRFNPKTGKRELTFSFNEALQKDAVTCRLSGIGPNDMLYAYVIAATYDLFAMDLDLP